MVSKNRKLFVFPLVILALSGCSTLSSHQAPVDPMVKQATTFCLHEGARPKSPLFYSCVHTELQHKKIAEAVAHCNSPAMQNKIAQECRQSDSIGDADYGQKMQSCRIDLTSLCKQLAK